MGAIAGKDVEAFVRDGFKRTMLILIYGPNEGLVSERASAIAKATTDGDASRILRLDGDAVAADPLSLADEANAISMFGGLRAIRVRLGTRALTAALEPLLATPPLDARIVIEAGDLKPTHPLRALVEKSKQAVALPCYSEDHRDLERWLTQALTDARMQITSDAKALLLDSLGADRGLSRSEVDKLLLYVGDAGRISVEDVEATITDAAVISVDAVLDAAFLGRTAEIDAEARRVFADGTDPGVLLGFALRHAFLLHAIRDGMTSDRDAAESIKRHRVPWKRERVISDQLQRWSVTRLDRAVQLISDAMLQVRKTASLSEALSVRCLWSVALLVNRK